MKLTALKINQNGQFFYLCSLRAKDLANEKKIKTDIWNKELDKGYQRVPTESRAKQFATYLEKAKGVSPTSVLLSSREDIKFTPFKDNKSIGTIEINNILWIIDGQHRINGLKYLTDRNSNFSDFEVPAIVYPLKSLFNEAKQFVIINRTQKGVKADLAERFLLELSKKEGSDTLKDLPKSVTRGIEWIPRAIKICDTLNEEKGNLWYNKIQLPNNPKKETTVSQKAFTDSLEPILNNNLLTSYSEDELAVIITRYWKAVEKVMPAAFDYPMDYVIQRTCGVFVMHRFLPVVLSYCTDSGANSQISVAKLQDILSKIGKELKPEFWANDGMAGMSGTSQKSFSYLFNKLKESLGKKVTTKQIRIRPFKL